MKTNQQIVRLGLAVLAMTLVAGCKSKPKTVPPPTAATPQQVQAIRTAYWHAYPDSRVGVVNVADKTNRLVSVAQVNGAEFREGQTVIFIDAKQKVLANGTVVRVLADQVHVQYEPAKGGRAPVPGDIMVRIPVGGTTL